LKNEHNITVLGAGVSGLTSAILLAERGYKVQIITKDLPQNTTSAVAAAIWFPYEAYPEKEVARWSYESFLKFQELAEADASGVMFTPLTTFMDTRERPWWLDALPESHILDDKVPSPVHKDHQGYTLNVPLIETPIYLPFLIQQFEALGGNINQREIQNIDELNSSGPIINCTGLGARKLWGDTSVYPIQGQIIKVEPNANVQAISAEYAMGEQSDELAYIIPRRDCIVLGGSAKKHQFSTEVDDELSKRIVGYCGQFQPIVNELEIQDALVGLRPGRSSIRVEKDPLRSVIHNYGHGGAGYTVSWGCAHEVFKLIFFFRV